MQRLQLDKISENPKGNEIYIPLTKVDDIKDDSFIKGTIIPMVRNALYTTMYDVDSALPSPNTISIIKLSIDNEYKIHKEEITNNDIQYICKHIELYKEKNMGMFTSVVESKETPKEKTGCQPSLA